MIINLPINVKRILNELDTNGFQGFAVGGCVRDSLMAREPKDWDITTDARPENTMQIFSKAGFKNIPTGAQHGTITVLMDNIAYEVTTYRIDGCYTDARRPDSVEFTTSIVDDLARRDFTINAMAYNDNAGLIDPFEGQKAIKDKLISCVGDPDTRFNEDALRMLRAVRFSAQLGFSIEDNTKRAIKKNNELIKRISNERIKEELNRILLSKPAALYILHETGLLNYFLPEFENCIGVEQQNRYHIFDVGKHILKTVEAIEENLVLRLTMLLHDSGKPQCKTIDDKGIGHFYGHDKVSALLAKERLKILKYDNNTIKQVTDLILYHDLQIAPTMMSVRKWLNKLGKDSLNDLLKVKEADCRAQNPVFYKARHEKLEAIKLIMEEIINNHECFSIKDLAIDGDILKSLGFKEGKEIGRLLQKLLDAVIDDPRLNTRERLIEIISR